MLGVGTNQKDPAYNEYPSGLFILASPARGFLLIPSGLELDAPGPVV